MRNQIVVGLDDSPSGKAGLQWAAEQARSVGAVLRAVHALGRQYGFAAPDIADHRTDRTHTRGAP